MLKRFERERESAARGSPHVRVRPQDVHAMQRLPMREGVNIAKTSRSCQVIFETFQYSSHPPLGTRQLRAPRLHLRLARLHSEGHNPKCT
jgi:hypothetical protein